MLVRRLERGQMARGKILSIDDDSMVTQALRRLLSPRYEVTVVDDARLAFDLLVVGQRFDVIICDVFMPLLNGMRFYDQVAALDPSQAARIVFLTGGSTNPDLQAFLKRVPNRRLEKPFSPRALEALVDELVPLAH